MDAGFELRTVTIKEAVSTNMKYKSKNSFDLLMIARDTSILQLLIGNKPEPSKQFAHFLLNEGASLNPGPWKLHSIEVAESAEKIAKAVVKNGGNLNSDKAYIYGLLDSYESVQETAVLLIKHYELNIVNSLHFQAILHYI